MRRNVPVFAVCRRTQANTKKLPRRVETQVMSQPGLTIGALASETNTNVRPGSTGAHWQRVEHVAANLFLRSNESWAVESCHEVSCKGPTRQCVLLKTYLPNLNLRRLRRHRDVARRGPHR
jgi:hypothetical protein